MPVFPLPADGFLEVLKLPFTLAKCFCVEAESAGGRDGWRNYLVKHFVKNDVLHEVFGHNPLIQGRVDADEILVCIKVGKLNIAARFAHDDSRFSPGDHNAQPIAKVLFVHAAHDRGEIEIFSFGHNRNRTGGSGFRLDFVRMLVDEYTDVLFVFFDWIFNKAHKRFNDRHRCLQEYPVEAEFDFARGVRFFQGENVSRVVVDAERNVSPIVEANFPLQVELSAHGNSLPV